LNDEQILRRVGCAIEGRLPTLTVDHNRSV
jgi:hypothetical protein